jgi:DNA-directed RNA polymerase subunit K/omega
VLRDAPARDDKDILMQRPSGIGAFQFVILASLRATQLMRGCLPRIEGAHKNTVIAQLEVSQGKVRQEYASPDEETGEAAALAVAATHLPVAVVDAT